MSGPGYPPDRYTGAAGQVDASLRRVDAPAELALTGGGAAHYLATGVTTGGAFGSLLLCTPGAPREGYFETLADTARREAMDEDDWTEFFLQHDTFCV
jgi:hypothetical protein